MGLFFLFGFILWGWAEMSAFIYIGGEIGGLFTLLGIFVTAIIGLSLLKSQGSAVMTKIRTDLAQGRAPVGSVADSISLAVGGILMLIPGYVTDGIGVLLFIPGLRTIVGAWMLDQLSTNNRFKGFVHVGGNTELEGDRTAAVLGLAGHLGQAFDAAQHLFLTVDDFALDLCR